MRGILRYSVHDPEFLNSLEGWIIEPIGVKGNYIYVLVDESDYKVKDKFDKGEIQSGDEVEYELMTDCYINKITNIATHETKAKVIFEKEQKQKLFLIDIDGTICDDIRNEEPELYPTANVFPRALEIINKWYDEGNVITFFTARESKDRDVTEEWLNKHGFKYHGLVMDKPRIQDEQEYVWIDNRKVRAVTYLGNWTELKEVDAKIQIFE
jgi:hypothetical protein